MSIAKTYFRNFLRPLRGGFLGLVCTLLFLLHSADEASAELFNPEVFTLDNGLTVVVVTKRRAPIATQMIWYKVGAADEAPGESGLAHFLEHLMFKGTENLGPGEFSRIIAENGGRDNAFTSWDYTAYFQSFAKDRLEIMMKHEADRMNGLVLTDEVVLPEREVVREERRSRIDNDPASQLYEVMRSALFLNHPSRRPVIGWDHEISALSTENALAFYRRWYAPNNATLVIAGDVSFEEVKALAERYYGPIPFKEVPERLREEEPPQNAARSVTLVSPRVRQPSFSLRYLAPSYRTAEGDDAYALLVLSEIMGGGATSRLYSKLVVEEGIASSAGSAYSGDAYDYSAFSFWTSPRGEATLDEAEAALRAEIAALLAEGVNQEEVERAKTRMVDAAVFARDSLSAAPNIIGRAITTGRSLEELEAWPERIAAVTADAVNAVARKTFVDRNSVAGHLLPEDQP